MFKKKIPDIIYDAVSIILIAVIILITDVTQNAKPPRFQRMSY